MSLNYLLGALRSLPSNSSRHATDGVKAQNGAPPTSYQRALRLEGGAGSVPQHHAGRHSLVVLAS